MTLAGSRLRRCELADAGGVAYGADRLAPRATSCAATIPGELMITEAKRERWRLTATWLNTIAAGFIVTGIVVPAVAWSYQAPGYHFEEKGLIVTAALIVVGVGYIWLRVSC